jgi:hypothetical protein
MPPITSSPQNTRTGLISWLVVFVILFVVAAIFAIYYDVQYTHAAQASGDLTRKMAAVASESDLTSPGISSLTQARGGGTAIQRLITQRDNEARIITGNDKAAYKDFKDVTDNVVSTLQAVEQQLKSKNVSVSLPADNLLQSVRLLGNQVSTGADAMARAESDAKAANDRAVAVTKERDQLLAEKDKQIAAVQADLQKAQAETASYQEGKNKSVADIEQSAKVTLAGLQKRIDELTSDLAKAETARASDQNLLTKLQGKLNHLRLNPTDSLQRPDGRITRVPGNGRVYISIGQNESVTPGLTFEVYDSHKGLPKLTPTDPTNDVELPAGKASIEVLNVLPGTSECRVIKTAPGQTIVEGDFVENLVYDPNTRYNFVVYGSFDLGQTGTASSGDAATIRDLVTRFGGRLQDQVNVDTDFVVLGKEPVAPAPVKDEDGPLAQRRAEEAKKALNDYQELKDQAIKLGIPILNQNRFLYFTGYYDQARR